MKKHVVTPRTLSELTELCGLSKTGMKYTQAELINMLYCHISGLEGRLDTAKNVYRQQRKELDALKSPELWAFKAPNHIPPDYKAEYLRRLKKGIGPDGMRIVIDKPSTE